MTCLTEMQKTEIEAALYRQGASQPCPRCGHTRFELLDGYVLEFVQRQKHNMVVGADNRQIAAVMVCAVCGWMAQHSLATLGL